MRKIKINPSFKLLTFHAKNQNNFFSTIIQLFRKLVICDMHNKVGNDTQKTSYSAHK